MLISSSSPHIDVCIRTKIDFQKISFSEPHYSENNNSLDKDPEIAMSGPTKVIFANFEGIQLAKKTPNEPNFNF